MPLNTPGVLTPSEERITIPSKQVDLSCSVQSTEPGAVVDVVYRIPAGRREVFAQSMTRAFERRGVSVGTTPTTITTAVRFAWGTSGTAAPILDLTAMMTERGSGATCEAVGSVIVENQPPSGAKMFESVMSASAASAASPAAPAGPADAKKRGLVRRIKQRQKRRGAR